MNPFKQIVKETLGAVLPRERFLLRGPKNLREIALTFDDGPHEEETPRLLDLLKELGISGTFFVVGEKCEKHPELVRRIVSEGHALGHHSWSHSEPRETSAEELTREIVRTVELLEGIAGSRPMLFRPPKGMLTWSKFRELLRMRQTIVLWNIDPRDYAVSAGETLAEWCESYSPTGGDIVLFHDNHPHCRGAIRRLVSGTKFEGWGFRTLEEWVSTARFHEKVVTG